MGVRLVAAVCSVAAGAIMVVVAAVWMFGPYGLAAVGGMLAAGGLLAVPVAPDASGGVKPADGFVGSDVGAWK